MKLENSIESALQMIMMSAEAALSATRMDRLELAKKQLEDINFHSHAVLQEIDRAKGKVIDFNGIPLRVLRKPDTSLYVYTIDGQEITDLLMPETLDRIETAYFCL